MQRISFEKPPLNELVLGVQFSNPLISNEDIFNLYNTFFKHNFPRIHESPLLPVTIEKIDRLNEFRIAADGNTRKVFVNNDTLIQIQGDRFLLNWRKLDTADEYPHFDNVYQLFVRELNNLFSLKEILKTSINQYEITYVDHLLDESFSEHRFAIKELFNFISLNDSVKSFVLNFVVPQPLIEGNLSINIKTGIRVQDQKPLIVLESTCRGYLPGTEMEDWFAKARTILVNFFVNGLTEKMKSTMGPKTR